MIVSDSNNRVIASSNSLDFLSGDKLAHFIVAEKKLSPVKVAIIVYGFSLFLSLIIAWAGGRLFPGGNFRALLEDYFYAVAEVLVPIVWGYYVWISKAPKGVLEELEATGIVALQGNTVREVNGILRDARASYLALIFAFATGGLLFYQVTLTPPYWLNSTPVFVALRVSLVIIPTAYATWSAALRFLINAQVFGKILKDVRIHPLHPDGAGGLRPLGRYALATIYPLAIGGSIAGFVESQILIRGEFAIYPYFHVLIVLYFLLAPVVFFTPLWTAHNAMRRVKEDLILEISRQFDHELSVVRSELVRPATDLKSNLEKIEQLRKMNDLVHKFPEWPFDIETIRRFIITVFSPVLPTIIPVIVSLLSQF